MVSYEKYKEIDLLWLKTIPAHWDIQRAKTMFEKANRPVEDIDDTVTCFRDGIVTLRKNRRTTGFTESIKEIGYQGIRKGDLVIHQMDAFAGAIGVSDSDGKSTPVYSVCITKSREYNNYFYAFIVREMAKTGFIQSLYRGIRERSSDFRFETFGKQSLPIPPRPEQDQIVKFLDNKISKINKFIKDKKREIQLLKETKLAEINHAVTKGLNRNVLMKDTGIDRLGKIPEHWEVRRLKYAMSFNPSIEMEIQDETPVSFMPMECLRNDFIEKRESSFKVVKGYVPFKNGDVVMAKVTPCFENGNIAVAKDLTNGVGFGTSEIFVFRCKEILLNTYLLYFLQTEYFRNKGIASMTGTGGLKRVSPKIVQNIPFPLPHINEQSTIVETLNTKCNTIEKLITSIQDEIDKIQEYKTSLISEVITGKVDVRDVKVSEDFESVTMEETEAETEEVIEE